MAVRQGVSAWNFDVAALKEQALKEGGLEAMLPSITEGMPADSAAPAQPNGEPHGWLLALLAVMPAWPRSRGILLWGRAGAKAASEVASLGSDGKALCQAGKSQGSSE